MKWWTITGKMKRHVVSGLVQHLCPVSEGVWRRMATLTSLLTPVKIDGDPSGQTCEQGWKKQGGRRAGMQQSKRQISKDPPVHADTHNHRHTHKSMTFWIHFICIQTAEGWTRRSFRSVAPAEWRTVIHQDQRVERESLTERYELTVYLCITSRRWGNCADFWTSKTPRWKSQIPSPWGKKAATEGHQSARVHWLGETKFVLVDWRIVGKTACCLVQPLRRREKT